MLLFFLRSRSDKRIGDCQNDVDHVCGELPLQCQRITINYNSLLQLWAVKLYSEYIGTQPG